MGDSVGDVGDKDEDALSTYAPSGEAVDRYKISVLSCLDLAIADTAMMSLLSKKDKGSSDPYVKILYIDRTDRNQVLEREILRTSTVMKSLSPCWTKDNSCEILLPSLEKFPHKLMKSELRMEVWDYDRLNAGKTHMHTCVSIYLRICLSAYLVV